VQRLEALLRQATRDGTVPGAVVWVAHGGQVVWHAAYGAAAITPQWRPMQCDTLFDLASLTKVIATTSLLLVAQHMGACTLDDRLQRFYPSLQHTTLGGVTVRQLLAHTGGLAAWAPLYQQLLPAGPAQAAPAGARARRALAAQWIIRRPLVYSPGAKALYSDLGFMLLGDILETCYQQPLETLFLRHVTQPLGLEAMAYRPLAGAAPLPPSPQAYAATEACPWRQRVLMGEVHDENAWAMGGVAAHAGLFATAAAVGRFAQALTAAAAGRSDWLPAALIQQSWQRHPGVPDSTRALGWDTPTPGRSSAGDYLSPHAVGHLGFTGCSLWIDPQHQVTVVLCTNRVHPTRQAGGITRLRPAVHNCVMQDLGVATP
jgi:CubicO group peptidase (beta-lactamase class C family)